MCNSNCRLIKNDRGIVFCLDLLECFQDRHKSISPKCFNCPFYLTWEENITGIDLDSIMEKVKNPLLNKEEIISLITNQPTIEAIPIEWMKNKRDELEKEYHGLFHAYTDEGVNKQMWVLNDLYTFRTVLRYWEEENGIS